MDLNILSSVFNLLACPGCKNTSIELFDDLSKKNGCSNSLQLSCMTCSYFLVKIGQFQPFFNLHSCHWSHQFSTSEKSKGTYEVNRRFVYAMRSIGQGFTGAKKFCGIMNMPNLPTKNNYAKLVNSLKTVFFNVAKESMKNAAKELKTEDIDECGVSVDGSWQKRGYTSLNGCVTAISIDSRKILDIEPMSRHCKGCEVHNNLDRESNKYKLWKENHTNCKINFKGSAPAMEPEGAERIFKRLVQKHGLYYTKYYGDGDSKSFQRVENVYKDDQKLVEKLECIMYWTCAKKNGGSIKEAEKGEERYKRKGKID